MSDKEPPNQITEKPEDLLFPEFVAKIPADKKIDWSQSSPLKTVWIREYGKEKGLGPEDVDSIVLFEVVRMITGDDENCFAFAGYPSEVPVNGWRKRLAGRLNWEIGETKNTKYENVGTLLKPVSDLVENSDWVKQEDFDHSRSVWEGAKFHIKELAGVEELQSDQRINNLWKELSNKYRKVFALLGCKIVDKLEAI